MDLSDTDGSTPLHKAYQQKQLKTAQLLIKLGAKTDVVDNRNKIPADYIDNIQ